MRAKRIERRTSAGWLALWLLLSPLTLAAQPALTVEELLTERNEWKLQLAVDYINNDTNQTELSSQVIQVAPGQFITVPIGGDAERNVDLVALTGLVRYGLTLTTELFTRATGVYTHMRSRGPVSGRQTSDDLYFSSAWVGVQHQFSKDNETPALIAVAQCSVAENTRTDGTDVVFGKAWSLGLTTYRTIDPLVLSLNLSYNLNLERNTREGKLDPGNLLVLRPGIDFAVNNDVTLSGAFEWRWRDSDELDGDSASIDRTSTRLSLGAAYSWSPATTLRLMGSTNISGDGEGAEISIDWIHTFGR